MQGRTGAHTLMVAAQPASYTVASRLVLPTTLLTTNAAALPRMSGAAEAQQQKLRSVQTCASLWDGCGVQAVKILRKTRQNESTASGKQEAG